jgi:ADP-ribosylglycohydrolase
MALSILEILTEHGSIDCDALAASFGRRYEGRRGYGPSMHRVLRAIASGEPWRVVTAAQFGGQGSFGNGAAMRVAPLGAWFGGDMDRIVEEAHRSAAVTHAHPEAAAGAVAAGIAASTPSHPALAPEEFLRAVHTRVPAGEVATRLLDAIGLPPETSGQHVLRTCVGRTAERRPCATLIGLSVSAS